MDINSRLKEITSKILSLTKKDVLKWNVSKNGYTCKFNEALFEFTPNYDYGIMHVSFGDDNSIQLPLGSESETKYQLDNEIHNQFLRLKEDHITKLHLEFLLSDKET